MDLSPIRFSGLASGLDTESIVSELMRVERMPLDQLNQQKQLLEWQREDYRESNSQLLSLRQAAERLRLQSSFLEKTATGGSDAYTVTPKNQAIEGSFTFEVVQLATSASLAGEESSLLDKTSVLSASDVTMTINGVPILFAAGVTVGQFIEKVNNESEITGMRVTFDEGTRRFFFASTTTGAASTVDLASSSQDLMSALGFSGASDDGEGHYVVTATGTNAVVKFNGTQLEYAKNAFTIADLDFQLHATTDAASTFTVRRDVDSIVESIRSFVDAYNEVLNFLNGKLTEERYRDYLPLTDAQKEEMSDKQIELWEEKARSGLLKGDQIISRILSDVRYALSSPVEGLEEGTVNTLSQIGITTGSWGERGKLYLDEAKLREALQTDPEAVMNLFTAKLDENDEGTWGIGNRLYAELNQGIDRLSQKAGSLTSFTLVDNSSLSQEMRRLDENITKMEERLTQVENRYWSQFTVMEQALQQMNAQSAWLAQQFGGMA